MRCVQTANAPYCPENPNIFYTETRSYNPRLQLTQILTTNYAGATSFNMQHVYSTTQNNGQITQAIDAVSGETIDYAYDSLNRLITAATTGPQWGLSFGYDGFGNRRLTQTVTKGSAPASSLVEHTAMLTERRRRQTRASQLSSAPEMKRQRDVAVHNQAIVPSEIEGSGNDCSQLSSGLES